MGNPYEHKKAVFTPGFVNRLRLANRAARHAKYPELAQLERLLKSRERNRG